MMMELKQADGLSESLEARRRYLTGVDVEFSVMDSLFVLAG